MPLTWGLVINISCYSANNVLYLCFTLNAVCLQAVSDKLNIIIF